MNFSKPVYAIDILRRLFSSGRFWLLVSVTATFIAGWFMYDAMMAPRWMRDFGLDISNKARIVSVNPGRTVFSSLNGRPEPKSYYICFSESARFEWNRVYFVASGGQVSGLLSEMDWQGENLVELNRRMRLDDRYQLIAFENNGRIIEHGFYFTMWANISSLATDAGFSKADAVFLADSDGETYELRLADSADGFVCGE